MLRLSVSVIALAILSGCTSNATLEKNHQQTLAAINNVSTHVDTKINDVSTHVEKQQQYIGQLERKLASISKDIKFLKHKSLTQPKVIVEKQIIRIPVEQPITD